MSVKDHIKIIVKKIVPQKIIYYITEKRKRKNFPMNWSLEKRISELSELYRRKTGKEIDIDNPKTFNEKIQWLKIYYNHKDLSKIVCKYHFKKYIEERVGSGYTVPLYGVYKKVEEIDWDSLPNAFVLKSNCSSDGNYIEIIKDKSKINVNELREKMREWLRPENLLINSFCRAYYGVKPLIIAEQYIEQLDCQLYDYKFFCFNGNAKFAYVATNHWGEYEISVYDLSWNKMDVNYGNHSQNDVSKPKRLDEMIEISNSLAKEFPFVRVDFFETEDKLLLSELTFYPGGGFHDLKPDGVNYEWGKLLDLPIIEKNER